MASTAATSRKAGLRFLVRLSRFHWLTIFAEVGSTFAELGRRHLARREVLHGYIHYPLLVDERH